MRNIKHYTLWLMVLTLSGLTSTSLIAADRIDLSRQNIRLTDRNITGQVVVKMQLENSDSFDVTVRPQTHAGGSGNQYFYLRAKGRDGSQGQVKVHIDFPYDQLTPGGPYTLETMNSVEVNKTRRASNQYTQCPEAGPLANSGRVCKPLSFVIIDDGAIPQVLYEARLDLLVNSGQSEPVKKTITLQYKNTQSAIGIYSSNDRFLLNTGNNFTSENSFCVYSRGESRLFDVRLEGQGRKKQLQLQGKSRQSVAYHARVSGSGNRAYQPLLANTWLPAGSTQLLATRSSDCGAARNLWVELNIPEREVLTAAAGRYTGTLTVRVRAK